MRRPSPTPALHAAAATPLFLLLALGSCQQRAQPPPASPDQLKHLMKGDQYRVEPVPRPRLAPLSVADLGTRFAVGPLCALTAGGRVFLVSRAGAAVARIDGRVRILDEAGPVDASGGFFKGPDVTVSIGRPAAGAAGTGGAGITVADPRGDAIQKLRGDWGCRA